jgi:D-alanine-D-alanine ligase
MRIAVAHNAVGGADRPDEADVLVQAEAVEAALAALGHEATRLSCDLDLSGGLARLGAMKPDLVFNLVEGLAGHGRLIHVFPALLEAVEIPFAGADAEALFLTSNKVLAKERMDAAGLPTPGWIGPAGGQGRGSGRPGEADRPPERWILKSVWEHASVGLDDDAVVDGARGRRDVLALLEDRTRRLGDACFAERFVEGREFNLSLLETADGVAVLPPAEIRFEGFGADRPRIVGYKAKWEEGSFEYRHTPRCFGFPSSDRDLLARLRGLAVDCWRCFRLRGWARVDFRVDESGRPFVLEVNANPCLSPDAGFAAAVDRAGMSFETAIGGILAAARPPGPGRH